MKYSIFDEFGDRYVVENIDGMLQDLDNDGLEVIYKPSRYFHHLNSCIQDLVKDKVLEQTEGEEYDAPAVELALKAFEGEIKHRLGEDVLAEWIEETDAQWEANKPDFDKDK